MNIKLIAVAVTSAVAGFVLGRAIQQQLDIVEVEKMVDDITANLEVDPLGRNHKVNTKKSYGRFGEL